MQKRSLPDIANYIVSRSSERYGANDTWEQLRDAIPLLLTYTTTGEQQIAEPQIPQADSSAGSLEARMAGGWLYNVSDSWLELLVLSVPVVLAAGTGTLPVAIAALPLIVPLFKNLKRLDPQSDEYKIYEAVAEQVGRDRNGPTREELRSRFSSMTEPDFERSMNELQFNFKVLKYQNGRYIPTF
jgi:hypothetical protein